MEAAPAATPVARPAANSGNQSAAPPAPAASPAARKTPLWERINFRILFFAAVLAAVIGYPVYVYLESVLTGGVRELPDGLKQVDLKSMSSFVFDQQFGTEQDIPERWRALNGQRVRLEGEMVPPSYAARGGGAAFELVYSVSNCCYSGVPQIQHFVQCRLPAGKQVPYVGGLVRVDGTLRVNVTRDPETNAINGVYHLDVEGFAPVD